MGKTNKVSKKLQHSLLLKFTVEDRRRIDFLQENGFNISQLFRVMIKKEYDKIRENND